MISIGQKYVKPSVCKLFVSYRNIWDIIVQKKKKKWKKKKKPKLLKTNQKLHKKWACNRTMDPILKYLGPK